MEEKRYQFFISSTYDDLKEERQEILNVILRLNHIPAGMEFFSAVDQEQLDFIRGIIDESDYYVLILAARYGSVDDDGISYTEREYDYAVSKGKKVIALVHANPDKIEREKTDKDENLFKKLIKFRNKVKKGRLVSFWENTTELVSKFQSSLVQTIKLYPEIGWMRGDSVISSPKMQKEIDSLKQEKQNLVSINKDLLEKYKVLEQANKNLKEQHAKIEHDMFREIEELKQNCKNLTNQIQRDVPPKLATESFESSKLAIESFESPKLATESFEFPKLAIESFESPKLATETLQPFFDEEVSEKLKNRKNEQQKNEIIIEACSATNPFNKFSENEIKCIALDLEIEYEEREKYLLNKRKVDIEKFKDMLNTCCILLRFSNTNSFDINIDDVEHHFFDFEGNELTKSGEITIDNKMHNIVLEKFTHTLCSQNQFPIKLNSQTSIVYTCARLFQINHVINMIYKPVIYVNHMPIYNIINVRCKIIQHKLHVSEIVDIINNLVIKEKFNESGAFDYVNSVIMDNGWM